MLRLKNTLRSRFRLFSKKDRILSIEPKNIRNFCIIAHIDHGKSTLADRLIEFCREDAEITKDQILDKLQVERDRGITVKAQSSSLLYTKDKTDFLINLVDTPGHSDFAYEVERSLKSCEGALLVVDSAQGIQAQTLAHYQTAKKIKIQEKEIFGKWSRFSYIPVLNKIDLPAADPMMAELQVAITLGLEVDKGAIPCSAKTGEGIQYLLDRIISDFPSPIPLDYGVDAENQISVKDNFRAFVFDSWYQTNKGVYFLVRVMNGEVAVGDKVVVNKIMEGKELEVREVGVMNPEMLELDGLKIGMVGFILLNVKDARESVKGLGATIVSKNVKNEEGELQDFKHPFEFIRPIPELIEPKQLIYASIFPETPDEFTSLNEAIKKLLLEDPAVSVEIESSPALGNGFRCGFLGSLHLDCFKQRIKDEFNLEVITTYPTVAYKAILPQGEEKLIYNPIDVPERCDWEEPWARAEILVRAEYLENIKRACESRHGILENFEDPGDDQFLLTYDFPMSEIITDFVDLIKTNSRGYASINYEFLDYRPADIKKVTIFITNEPVDALSFLVREDRAFSLGKKLCGKLQKLIPRQLFVVKIQAKVGSKVIASEKVSSYGKNVLARCYGGDYTRKKKLMENQKKGKKKMRELGRVSIPTSTINKIFRD